LLPEKIVLGSLLGEALTIYTGVSNANDRGGGLIAKMGGFRYQNKSR
jgi:hypothetical protein